MGDSPGLVEFATGLLNSVLHLPDGQETFFGKFKLPKNCIQCCSSKNFFDREIQDQCPMVRDLFFRGGGVPSEMLLFSAVRPPLEVQVENKPTPFS